MARWVTIVLLTASVSFLLFISLAAGWGLPRELVLSILSAGVVAALIPDLRSLHGVSFVIVYGLAYLSASMQGQGKSVAVGGLWIILPTVIGGLTCVALLVSHLSVRWPAAVGMVGIGILTAFFSGPPGGVGKFVRFLREVIGLSPELADAVNFFVRKGIHLGVYGLLALCAGYVVWQAVNRKSALWAGALAWGLGHAVLDETTQMSTTVRTGSLGDVVLDLTGMALALLLLGRFIKKGEG